MADSVSFKVVGKDKLATVFKSLALKTDARVASAINAGTMLIHGDAFESILKGPNSGIIYGKREHQSSAAGQAPANDTGTLSSGLQFQLKRSRKGFVTGIIRSTAAYSAALEFGTKHMEPRPFLRPAFDKNIGTINAMIAQAIRDGAK